MLKAAAVFAAILASTPAFAWTIEAECQGGRGGRFRSARLTSAGEVWWSGSRTDALAKVATVPAGKAAAFSARLDAAGFEGLRTRPSTRRVKDGVNCKIRRVGARTHEVRFMAAAGRERNARESAAADVMHDILALGTSGE